MAEHVGATRQTIGLIEAGRYNPSLKLCTAICKTLGVTLNDLFWDEDAALVGSACARNKTTSHWQDRRAQSHFAAQSTVIRRGVIPPATAQLWNEEVPS